MQWQCSSNLLWKLTNGSNMQITITLEDEKFRVSNRWVVEEVDDSVSPKDILYEMYQSTKKQMKLKGNENE